MAEKEAAAKEVESPSAQQIAAAELDNVVRKIDELFFPDPTEKYAFHYTKIEHALKILSGTVAPHRRPSAPRRSLWFADARTMNDTKEVSEGEELFDRAIRRGLGDKQQQFRSAKAVMPMLQAKPFVLSMSKFSDSLSMWRAYGGDGEGVALKVSLEALRQLDSLDKETGWHSYTVAPCLYRRHDELEDTLASLVTASVQRIGDEQAVEFFLANLDMRLDVFLPYIKNCSYEEEQEVRAVYSLRYGVAQSFCLGRPPRQFIELTFEDSLKSQLFVGATVGPSPNALFHQRAIEALLVKAGDGGVVFPSATMSTIPYRGKAGA